MNRSDLVAAFQDTVAFSESDVLREKTAQAAASSKVYLEGFQARSHPEGHSATITVEEDTTFSAAKRYFVAGKTAVLNFANPVTPGGGAQNGAMAQEECLCRSSNLYVCLTSSPFLDYYQYNRSLHNHFYSDRIIYTKGVTVFKTDDEIPRLMPEHDWFQVDVITCAAPYIAKRKYTNRTVLKNLFKSRIKNIFEVALENGITTLILGAFGCGAFKNPPELVASAFYETINENRYAEQFDRIVFAIKKSERNTNYQFFSEAFCPILAVCPEFTLDEIPLPSGKTIPGTTVGFTETLGMITQDTVKEWVGNGLGCPVSDFGYSQVRLDENEKYIQHTNFVKWQVQNRFYKKQFSILGDSISTLDGYNPKGYKLFYTGDTCDRTGVHEMKDTWWGKVIDFFGGELHVNNSWSGSRVTKLPNQDTLFPSGCSDERTGGLHIGEVMPDVIIVYLGTNDWAFGTAVEAEQGNYEDNDTFFAFAYRDMLAKVKRNYPNAEVFCCTLNETYMSAKPSFRFPYSHGGIHIERYNAVIRDTAKKVGCKVIELFDNHIPYDAVDGTHPTVAGMNTLATLMLRGMCNSEGAAFLNCEGEHDFIIAEEYTGGSRKICRKCGLQQHSNSFLPPENEKLDHMAAINPKRRNIMQLTKCANGHFFDRDKYICCPHCGAKALGEAEGNEPKIANTKSDFMREALETGAPSEIFASGAVFDISRQQRENFEEIVRSGNSGILLKWFIDAYNLFCENPAIVNFPFSMATADKNDVCITEMNADIFALPNGSRAALCFMPIQSDVLDARIIGIILSDTGDRYYYCMLKKDEDALSDVFRNKALQGLEKIGKIKGRGFELMNSFLDSIKNDLFTTEEASSCSYCSSETTEEKPQKIYSQQTTDTYIGKVIGGKYKLLALIGSGGMTEVYLALDTRLNKPWAVKIFRNGLNKDSDLVKNMLLNEANMIKSLNHPAIPRLVDVINTYEYLAVVMDYVEGETLENIVKEFGAQPVEQVLDWAKQLCDVLGYLHSQNPPIFYLDMKPANVILQPNGNIKIIDFGIMRLNNQPNLMKNTCNLGTLGYVAPDNLAGSGYADPRSDIYSLGVTIHRLLTAYDPTKPPHQIPPIRSIKPDLPKGLEYIIDKCVQPVPTNRYQDCMELMRDLNNIRNLPPKKGFFGSLFGKKGKKSAEPQQQWNPTVVRLYNGMDANGREKIFYGGIPEAQHILLSLANDTFHSTADDKLELCLQIYVQCWIRSRGGFGMQFQTPTYIKQMLVQRFAGVSAQDVVTCVERSLEIIYQHEPQLKESALSAEIFVANVAEKAKQNVEIQDLYLHDEEYGKKPNKPIFVNGFGSDKEYLSHLYAQDGVKLAFERVGSSEVDGICGSVDLYKLLLPDGGVYMNIFLCNYGTRNTTNVPKGVVYR